jgi:hypothetical protein
MALALSIARPSAMYEQSHMTSSRRETTTKGLFSKYAAMASGSYRSGSVSFSFEVLLL